LPVDEAKSEQQARYLRSQDSYMTKFCPYCGIQLSERSKFCPRCGKSKPERRRQAQAGVEVSVDESHAAVDTSPARDVEMAQAVEAGARTVATISGRNGRARPAPKRFAPRTHTLIGSSEQAGFGLRYGAWMFDFLITLIGIMVFTFVVTAASRKSVVGSNADLVIVAGLTVVLLVVNFIVLAGAGGQTAGMRILGIYIVRVDGRPFTMKQAALRHLLGYPLSMAVFFLGFLWMLWDPRQQGWHDKIARTIVVMSR
jgi:uncharacterized RDD family membrane protein YckC